MKFIRILHTILLSIMSMHLGAQSTELPHYTNKKTIHNADLVNELENIRKWGAIHEDSAMRALGKLYSDCSSTKDDEGLTKILRSRAVLKMHHGAYENAKLTLYNALNIISQNDAIQKELVPVYVELGNVNYYLSDYRAASDAYFKALEYYKIYPDQTTPLSHIYNNLSGTLVDLGQRERAIDILNNAYREALKDKDSIFMATIQTNLGSCYFLLNDFPKSELHFKHAVAITEPIKAHDRKYKALLGLGNLYKAQKKYVLALASLEDAYALRKEHSLEKYGESILLISIGDISRFKKDYQKAAQYYDLVAADAHKTAKVTLLLLRGQGQLAYAKGDYKKAFEYNTRYHDLNDSIINKEMAVSVNEMEVKYRSAEKDKEIFESRLLLSEQKVKLNNKNLWILGISSLALILMAIGGAWVVYRNKKNKIINNVIKLQSRIEGEEQERMRISHELHDGVNSQLTAVKSFMIAAQDKFSALKHLDEFNTAKQILSETATEIRNIAHSMAPGNLLNIGLASAIRTFCDKIFMANNIHYNFETAGDVSLIEQNLALNIYRIVQELCNNIVKHARATSVTIICSNLAQEVLLIVEDNGKGLSENYLQYSDGMGLKGVRERVAMFQGVLLIESEVNKNTTFSITFDLHKAVPKTS